MSKKLSIYEDPTVYPPETPIQPSQLQLFIQENREIVSNYFQTTHHTLENYRNDFIRFEQNANKRIQELKHDSEPILPNSFYVLVSGFSASILFKKRNIALRVFMPIVFGLGGFVYFYPKTTNNICNHPSISAQIEKFK